MKIISHRGNINGPSQFENDPNYIYNTLNMGYNVEIDIWVDWIGTPKFGHDKPIHTVPEKFNFNDDRLWFHAKNILALEFLKQNNAIHYFYHQEDDCTLTSSGFFWTYPRNLIITKNSIVVLPEKYEPKHIELAHGICTDYCLNYKEFNK